MLGLNNETTLYPFVDLWGLPHASEERANHLAAALPETGRVRQLFNAFRSLSYHSYPSLADIDQFEVELGEFCQRRDAVATQGGDISGIAIHGKSYHWLALLFAVLASGVQVYCEETSQIREVHSRSYSEEDLCKRTPCGLTLEQFVAASHACASPISWIFQAWKTYKPWR